MIDGDVRFYHIDGLARGRDAAGSAYHEFMRVPDLSAGLYVLPVGGTDTQQPHTEDEIYLVVSGRATLSAGSEEAAVSSGSLIYVAAGVPHHFHTIEEELRVLVFFAPAEYTRGGAAAPEAGAGSRDAL